MSFNKKEVLDEVISKEVWDQVEKSSRYPKPGDVWRGEIKFVDRGGKTPRVITDETTILVKEVMPEENKIGVVMLGTVYYPNQKITVWKNTLSGDVFAKGDFYGYALTRLPEAKAARERQKILSQQ